MFQDQEAILRSSIDSRYIHFSQIQREYLSNNTLGVLNMKLSPLSFLKIHNTLEISQCCPVLISDI